jgi:O-antigen/teichoic acid export membrane protein
MKIWVGRELSSVCTPIGGVLLFGVWINSLSYIPYSFLQAKGRPDLVAKFHVAELVPFLLLIWGAMRFFGVYGAAVAWSIRVAFDCLLLFYFSGMRNQLKALVIPAVMVLVSIVLTTRITNMGYLWHVGLAICLACWCGLWFKGEYSIQLASALRRMGLATLMADQRSG